MSKIILPPGFGRQGSIDDYAPLSQQELGTVAAPVMNAIAQGVPPDAETMVQFGVLCRLLVTVKTLGMAGAATEAQRDALAKELADLKAATPAPRLNLGFLSQDRPYIDCPICERVQDESGTCAFCASNPTATPSESL